jgi:arylsulfatase A
MTIRKGLAIGLTGAATLLLPALALTGGRTDGPQARDRPNIVLILADDLGIEGVGAYGGESFETPNIDRLAAEGMRFTQAFANPYCTPSRSELLTGRYPFATATAEVIWDYEMHGHQVLDAGEPSFARQLQKAGYSTAIAGKWQLSFLAHQDWVHELGFDTYMLWQIETADGERTTRYHNPHFRRDGRVIADEIADRYGPDVLVDYLIEFIEEKHEHGPFLAYYAALLPHFPWEPTPDSEDQTMPEDERYGDPKFFPDMVARLDMNVGRLLD